MDSMFKRLFCTFVLLFHFAGFAEEAPLSVTEYGHPDISGIWNFSTSTPLERAESYGNREFLTEDEIAALKAEREATWERYGEIEEDVSTRILAAENSNSVGSVNLFWGELFPLRENNRTSLIIHTGNGRVPPVKESVLIQRGDWTGITEVPGTRPVRYTHGGISRDGPEDRGLSTRCLVFNSGPPLRSAAYNNNIQIIQNSTHVAILTEMGFDA